MSLVRGSSIPPREKMQALRTEAVRKMRTLRERPARRGYFAVAVVSAVGVWACSRAFHMNPWLAVPVVVAGIALVTGVFSLRHRGINREVRRRR